MRWWLRYLERLDKELWGEDRAGLGLGVPGVVF